MNRRIFLVGVFALIASASTAQSEHRREVADTDSVSPYATQQLATVEITSRRPGTVRMKGAINGSLINRDELFRAACCNLGESNFYSSDFSQEGLYKFQSDAVRKAAAEAGNVVFVGRTADYILRDRTDKVDIFITANMAERVRAVAGRHGFTAEAARKYIEKKEDARSSYYNYYTGKRWGRAESYDLCVNSSLLGLEGTAEMVAAFIKRRFGLE